MRFEPYIGVTGFMYKMEVETVLAWQPRGNFLIIGPRVRPFMIGVLASSKTLAGMENKYPTRYPPVSRIADIFPAWSATDVVNLIHYSTDDPYTLGDQLLKLTVLGGPRLHGFQLNINWPTIREHGRVIRELVEYHERYPNIRMVLQIGRRAVAETEAFFGKEAPRELAKQIFSFGNLISDILFDMSGGRGELLDVEQAKRYLRAISEGVVECGLGVAGGLDGNTLPNIRELLFWFPNLSIDAENNLRDEEDKLSLPAVHGYISAATELCGIIEDSYPYEYPCLK
jgi:hypothetical protein